MFGFRLTIAFLFVALSVPLSVREAAAVGCEAAKLTGLLRASRSHLRCASRAAASFVAPDPVCTGRGDERLRSSLARAELRGGCPATGEGDDVERSIHALIDNLELQLVGSQQEARCASRKLKSTARRIKKEIACRRKAVARDAAFDLLCVAPAQEALARRFEREELAGDCSPNGAASVVEALVADFLDYAADLIGGAAPVQSPTGLSAVVNEASIDLVWTAPPAASGFTEARLLRRLNAAPGGPDDGAAAVVFEGAAEMAADDLTRLLPNTMDAGRDYHYAVYGCDSVGYCEPDGSHTTLAPTVTQALRAGGYVVHWRHASANVCSDDLDLGTAATTAVPDWWRSCDSDCNTATARQLNAAGRAEAPAISSALASLGIVIGRVLTSEFCRNFETAALMNFGPVIEETPLLTYFVYDEASRCGHTFDLLAQEPAAGTNTALIGHAGNVCPPLSTLYWAEAAIYKPDGLGGSTFIQRVMANAWLTLP